MKTSDAQMTPEELASLQGLGVVPKDKYVQMTPTELATLQGLGTVPNNPYVQMTPKELATLDGMGQIVAANPMLFRRGLLTRPDGQTAAQAFGAQMQAQLAAEGVDPRGQPLVQQQQQMSQDQSAMSFGDKLKVWMKNPYIIGGVVLAVGAIGFLVWKYTSKPKQLSEVEPLGLEGLDEKPKRKRRRKSRKSKK